MPSYPANLPEPQASGFTASAKTSTKDMDNDRLEKRRRKMSTGERYVGNMTFEFSHDQLRDDFLNFLKYDLNYGDYWFDANWLSSLNFTAGEWVFRFIDTKFQDSGFLSKHKYAFMMAPRSEIIASYGGILLENTWPISEGSNALIASNILQNGVQVTDDGNDLVVDEIPTPIVGEKFLHYLLSDSRFNYYQPVETANPIYQGKWFDVGDSVYKAGTGTIGDFLGTSVPQTTVFGIQYRYGLLGNPGGTVAGATTDDCESYGEIFTDDAVSYPNLQDNINAGTAEYDFAGYFMIGVLALPTIDFKVQFLSVTRNILYEKAFQYSINDNTVFTEWRASGIMPIGTRYIRTHVLMAKNGAVTSSVYAFILNSILRYRTAV